MVMALRSVGRRHYCFVYCICNDSHVNISLLFCEAFLRLCGSEQNHFDFNIFATTDNKVSAGAFSALVH